MVIQAYPVKVELTDVAIALIPVAVIGLLCAWTTSAFARSRTSSLPS